LGPPKAQVRANFRQANSPKQLPSGDQTVTPLYPYVAGVAAVQDAVASTRMPSGPHRIPSIMKSENSFGSPLVLWV